MATEEKNQHFIIRYLNFVFKLADQLILIGAALGIIGIASALLADATYDGIFFWTSHTIPHLLSEVLFVLIIMELFRQVLRQINKKPFSLNPFLFIGFIASIRGILLTQMSIAMGDIEWRSGIIEVVVHVGVLLILVICYMIYGKMQILNKKAGIGGFS